MAEWMVALQACLRLESDAEPCSLLQVARTQEPEKLQLEQKLTLLLQNPLQAWAGLGACVREKVRS